MTHDTHIGGPRDRFPLTRHTLVEATADPDPAVRERALEALIASYWKPAYKYVRLKWNADNEETKDLIQGFFAVALEKEYLARFDPAKARFRTYLRTCLDGYVSNERKAAGRLKRGGAYKLVSLDFEDAEGELRHHDIADDVDYDAMFHREWVRNLFALSVDALREHCEGTDRPLHFALFERYDLQPDETAGRPTYAELAAEFDVEVTKITNTLHAARKLFRQFLLERLAEICGSEEEFQREAQELLGIVPS